MNICNVFSTHAGHLNAHKTDLLSFRMGNDQSAAEQMKTRRSLDATFLRQFSLYFHYFYLNLLNFYFWTICGLSKYNIFLRTISHGTT
uniref:Uncharacterized protein n=1 Tax=Heterorhabditis bacteriophora TaxID=37862 RepID=A0A1I7W9T2_HETBA